MSATVYIGRTRLEIQIVRTRRTLKIRDSLGFMPTKEIELTDLFAGMSLDQLHQVMKPIFEAAQVARERDVRQLRQQQRRRIKERDNLACRYCGGQGDLRWGPDRKAWHIDHVVPVVAGGSDSDDNLVLACQSCNLAKSAKDLEDFETQAQRRSLQIVGGKAQR